MVFKLSIVKKNEQTIDKDNIVKLLVLKSPFYDASTNMQRHKNNKKPKHFKPHTSNFH